MGMHIPAATTHGRMVAQPTTVFAVGGSNPCQSTAIGGAAGMCTRPGFEPLTKKSEAGCTTIQPLLVMVNSASPLLGAKSATDENPNCVFLSNRT